MMRRSRKKNSEKSLTHATVRDSVQLNKSMELKKHVALIHSNNKLSLLQRKIANALLFNAYPYLLVESEHRIQISRLCHIIGYDSNDHKIIRNSLINLLSTVLEWNLIDGDRLIDEAEWNASSIIADASIKGPICTYSYSNKMKELLYRPHMYGRLDMIIQARFKSSYGLALYENCNRFQDIGQTPWFSIDMFRKLMGVEGDKYKIFRDFKNRVLDKAVEEVNKFSALCIKAQLRKQNRRVVSVQFLIEKQNTEPLELDLNQSETNIFDLLKMNYGFSLKQTKNVLEQYPEKYIREKINLIESSKTYIEGRVKNLAMYLISALRDDYQPVKKTSNHRTKATKIAEKSDAIDVNKMTAFKRFQDKKLFNLFENLSVENQNEVLIQFEKTLKGIYQDVYLRTGLENILIQDQLCDFLRRTSHYLANNLPTFSEWNEQNKN